MKKTIRITFSMLIIGCLLLGSGAIVQAINEDYKITEANATGPITVDGNWATGEWEDSWIEWLNYSTNNERFCFKADSGNGYAMEFLIDSADTTDDAGDIWQICLGVPGADTAPQADHHKVEITGHATLAVYVGDGSGWVEDADLADAITWAANASTIHDVPLDFEHACLEAIVDKAAIGAAWNGAPPIALRVAMYDETEATWLAWPPASDPDVPDTWGQIFDYASEIPDGFSIGVVTILSSVAVAAAFYSVRKRPKTVKYIP